MEGMKKSPTLMKQTMDSPASMPKMKPMLHMDMEDIKGLGNAEVGDMVSLKTKAKIKSIRQEGEGSDMHTEMGMDILRCELLDREMPEPKGKSTHEGM